MTVVLLAAAILYRSVLMAELMVCSALLCGLLIKQFSLTNKDKPAQERGGRGLGFFLLVPGLGLVGAGVHFVFLEGTGLSAPAAYLIGAVSILAAAGLAVSGGGLNAVVSPAARFLKLLLFAATAPFISLGAVLILATAQPADTDIGAIGCMTMALLGTLVLASALDMILVSRCGYRRTAESLRYFSGAVKSRRHKFVRAAIGKDIFLVAAKLLISIASMSFFMLANALYSAGMGSGRYIALKIHKQERAAQIKSYRLVGLVIVVSSVCYVLYSVRLFFGGTVRDFPMVIALVIACYTFVELGINIRDALRLRKSHQLEAKALRAIGLASTLLCFVLTQTAIMSFSAEGDIGFSSALAGVVFGGGAALVGVYVMVSSFLLEKRLTSE